MEIEYANCPFCGSNNVGPAYGSFEDGGKTWHIASISCADCAASGPVRNDYPENPIADAVAEAKADEIEAWTKAAWNRLPALTPEQAQKTDARRLRPNTVIDPKNSNTQC